VCSISIFALGLIQAHADIVARFSSGSAGGGWCDANNEAARICETAREAYDYVRTRPQAFEGLRTEVMLTAQRRRPDGVVSIGGGTSARGKPASVLLYVPGAEGHMKLLLTSHLSNGATVFAVGAKQKMSQVFGR
jgi:hypothetical protein